MATTERHQFSHRRHNPPEPEYHPQRPGKIGCLPHRNKGLANNCRKGDKGRCRFCRRRHSRLELEYLLEFHSRFLSQIFRLERSSTTTFPSDLEYRGKC